MLEAVSLAWTADGPFRVAETLVVDPTGQARLASFGTAAPDRLDRAGVFVAEVDATAAAALEAATEGVLAAPPAQPRPGALVLVVRRGGREVAVPAPDVEAGPAAELHAVAGRVAGEVAARPLAAVRLAASVFGPLSVAAGGIPRIDLESIGSEPVTGTIHLASLRFVAEAGDRVEDWLDAAAVERTGGLLTSLGRLVARDGIPAVLPPGSRAGLAIPDGLRPTRSGRARLHARLTIDLEVAAGGAATVELASPRFEVDVEP